MPPSLTGSIAGARFRFECDAADVLDYARSHLATSLAPLDAFDVAVDLRWHDGPPPARGAAANAKLGALMRVDRDLYVGKGVARWFRVDDLRDLWLTFDWDGKRLSVVGDFYFRLGNSARSDRLRRLLQPQRAVEQRRRRFTTLLYYLVYYPCWWWLEHNEGLHPLHAGGISRNGKAILLAGGSGIGKSTLSVALMDLAGAQFLADSFVVHRAQHILPVREPLLIDGQSREWIGDSLARLQPIAWSYLLNRTGFHVAYERLAEQSEAQLLLFPYRAAQPAMEAIEPARAAALLSAGDMIINDLRRYWSFAAVFEYLTGDGLMLRREQNLKALASSVKCFTLGLNASQSKAEAIGAIERIAG